VAGRPLDLKTLCSVLKTRSKRKVQKLAQMLIEEYRQRNMALEILELEDGVKQKQVVEVRGSHAYKHIKQLIDAGLVAKEKVGRNIILKTTPYFADYFGLSHDIKTMKKQLKSLFESFGSGSQQSKG